MSNLHSLLEEIERPASTPAGKAQSKKALLTIPPTGSLRRSWSPASSHSFGATQYGKDAVNESGPLDRQKSGKEVDHLLAIRREMVKAARKIGDDDEVYRLQNLSLFDSVFGDPQAKGGHYADTPTLHSEDEFSTLKTDDVPDPGSLAESIPGNTAEKPPIPPKSAARDTDPFLQIAHDAMRQPNRRRRQKKQPESYHGRCNYPRCLKDKACARYIRGKGCCIPNTMAVIVAAKERIAFFEKSPIIQQLQIDHEAMANREAGLYDPGSPEIEAVEMRIDTAFESAVIKQLELDREFVEEYDGALEARCAEGVWWEAWLVVEELRGRGIIGSVNAV